MQCTFITFIANLEESVTVEFEESCRCYSFQDRLPKDFGLLERCPLIILCKQNVENFFVKDVLSGRNGAFQTTHDTYQSIVEY
jgi:hypothetical protein